MYASYVLTLGNGFRYEPFLATLSFFGEKIFLATAVEQETDLAGLNSLNFYSRHVEFLRAPHMNRNKNSGPKGLLRSLSCQRSGPSLPLFTQEPELNSQNLYSGTEMYLGPTWVLYKLVGNFAMTGLTRNPNQTNGGPVTSPTEGGSGGASPPAFTRTTITSKSPSEAVFILLEVLLKPGSPYCSSVSCLSRSHVHTSGTKPAICLMWFLVINLNGQPAIIFSPSFAKKLF